VELFLMSRAEGQVAVPVFCVSFARREARMLIFAARKAERSLPAGRQERREQKSETVNL